MTARGRFITVEGGEGTGKTTLIAGLKQHLSKSGLDVVLTREPGGTPLAEALRTLLLSPPDDQRWNATAQTLLVNAARCDHIEKLILPALETGSWIICDRFADSTRVYQGLEGASETAMAFLEALVTDAARPDLTLVLDAPVESLMERRVQRGVSDIFEARPLEFHKAVRDRFLKIAKDEPDRCIVLDALALPQGLLANAARHIQDRFSAP